MKATRDYREDLLERLKDERYALSYLNACLQDDAGVFLLALRDVADAHGGIAKLSQKTKLNREHLFRMLSKKGNPRLENLQVLADAFGWQLALVEKGHSKLKRAA